MRNLHIFGTSPASSSRESKGPALFTCSSSVTVCFGDLNSPGVEEQWFDPTPVLRCHRTSAHLLNSSPIGGFYPGWAGLETVVVNPDYIIGPWDVKPTSGQLIVTMARRICLFSAWGKMLRGKDCVDAHIAALRQVAQANDISGLSHRVTETLWTARP